MPDAIAKAAAAKKDALYEEFALEEAAAEEDALASAALASGAVADGLSGISSTAQAGWSAGSGSVGPADPGYLPNAGGAAAGFASANGPIDPAAAAYNPNAASTSMLNFGVDEGTVANLTTYGGAGSVENPTPIYGGNGDVVAFQYVDNQGVTVTQPVEKEQGSEDIQFPDDTMTVPRPLSSSEPLQSVQPAPFATQTPQLTPEAQQQLNIAIQQAVGPYDPGSFNTGQPLSISDVLSVPGWMLSPTPTAPSPPPLDDGSQSVINQVLTGTYADHVLQSQLSSQGVQPGSFVSTAPPYDLLFNPNATNLVDATLLASRTPNMQFSQAQMLDYWAPSIPLFGVAATFMRPSSGVFAKTVAVVGALPLLGAAFKGLGMAAAELGEATAGLGEATELGSTSTALGEETNATLGQETNTTLGDETGAPGETEAAPGGIDEFPPSTGEQAAARFQDIVRKAEVFLRNNSDLITELGGSSRGAPITSNQLAAAIALYMDGNPGFARALGGNALEAVVSAIIEDLPAGEGLFTQISGPSRIDFIGTGAFAGYSFELTTEAGVGGHALRVYMQEPGAMIFTYSPIIE